MSYSRCVPGTVIRLFLLTIAVCLLPVKLRAQSSVNQASDADPNLWLEDVTGAQALDWVRKQNTITTGELEAAPGLVELQQRLLAIMDSDAKIPFVEKYGAYYYNFW